MHIISHCASFGRTDNVTHIGPVRIAFCVAHGFAHRVSDQCTDCRANVCANRSTHRVAYIVPNRAHPRTHGSANNVSDVHGILWPRPCRLRRFLGHVGF